jgi:hypothetical protein
MGILYDGVKFQPNTMIREQNVNKRSDYISPLLPDNYEMKGLTAFSIFTSLPVELRLKVWKFAQFPRRIILRRPSNQPALDFHSSGALLMTTKESRQIFLENYVLCFQSAIRRGLYINYSIDTISLRQGLKSLKWLKRCPEVMKSIRWLEIRPDGFGKSFDLGSTLISMTSLDLRIVRWAIGTEFNLMENDRRIDAHIFHRYILDTFYNIKSALRIGQSSHHQGTKLAAIFSPSEAPSTQVLEEERSLSEFGNHPCLVWSGTIDSHVAKVRNRYAR